MNDNRPNPDGVLEGAVQAWQQLPVPAGPPQEVLNRVRTMGCVRGRGRKLTVGLVRVAACIALVLLLWQTAVRLGFLQSSPAFADVVGRLRHTHSVFFKETATIEGQKPMVVNVTLADPGLMRMQRSGPGSSTIIFDESRSAGLLLLTEQKKAIALGGDAAIPKEVGSTIAWYRSLRDAQQDAVEDLGPRKIDGKAAFGFRVKNGRQQFDVWVESKTSLPIEAETTVAEVKGRVVLTDFAFDSELPGDLFSLTPPKGYTVVDKMKIAMPAEEDLTHLLRTVARLNDDRFPDDLSIKALQPILMRDKTPKSGDMEKDLPRAIKLTNGLMFIHLRQIEDEWRYTGKGVKLGDAGRIVCAWKRRGETKWRAAYGDLRIGSVTTEQIEAAGKR